jgi:hypothetical protein
MSKNVAVSLCTDPSHAPATRYSFWESQTNFLQGRILTIIDASYSDVVQRKAVKDLVRQAFQNQTKWVYEIICGDRMVRAAGETTPLNQP